ncbi:MAG: ammonium transporter [Planctomycetes bacterium]|nr:ammonium transporter [Planctomycetota bacterium]
MFVLLALAAPVQGQEPAESAAADVQAAAPAEPAAEEASTINALDTVWVLVAAFLVFFMQAGFAMVETGFTRAKNACNIMMKNLMDFSVGSLAYWVIGFGLMFGASTMGLFGKGLFFTSPDDPSPLENLPTMAFWIFQAVFAATAATIVSGAMAERTKFVGYLIYSALITAFVYPFVGHWIWGGGWLSGDGWLASVLGTGVTDFAGSTVVHSVGGWMALAGAIVLGPRVGKYGPNGTVKAITGHNIPLAALGVFILWFGWFGFNPGSEVAASGGSAINIANIAVTTNLAAAAGAVAAMFTIWIRSGKPDTSMTLNGALAGLVAITAGCAAVSPVGAVIIGLAAGVLVVLAVEFIDQKLKIDDPVGAVSVHGVCGAFGTLCVGLFATDGGLFYGGGLAMLGAQATAVATVFVWCMVLGLIIFKVVSKTVGLRVTREEEIKGLDLGEHGLEAYSGFQIFTTE